MSVSARRGEVLWLNNASEPDEILLVRLILDTYVEMKKAPFGSLKWERLDARHSTLLDVTDRIFRLRDKANAVRR